MNTITPFNNSPLSKTSKQTLPKAILKSPTEHNNRSTKQVRFQLPPHRYNHHDNIFDTNQSSKVPQATPIFKAALDSAATTNCFPANYRGTNHQPHTKPSEAIIAQTANDSIMTSIATDLLNTLKLPLSARKTHLFNEINIPYYQSTSYALEILLCYLMAPMPLYSSQHNQPF